MRDALEERDVALGRLVLAVAAGTRRDEDELLVAVSLGQVDGDARTGPESAVVVHDAVDGQRLHGARQGRARADLVHHVHDRGHVILRPRDSATGVAFEGLDADACGVAHEGIPVEGHEAIAQRALVEVVGVEEALSAQDRPHASRQLGAVASEEGHARAPEVARDVVDGVAGACGDAADVAEVDALLEKDAGDACRVARTIASALKDQGAVAHVVLRILHGRLLSVWWPRLVLPSLPQ